MPWLSRNNFTPQDKLHADDLNYLANDHRTWGGDVNGGGYVLSNVILASTARVGEAPPPVTSVFTRTGDIVALATDYTPAFIGAVPINRLVTPGPGLSGGGSLQTNIVLSANVRSVFTRTGDVTLTAADVAGATGVLNTRQILTGTGLTGGGNLSADRTLTVVPDSTDQKVLVQAAGTLVSTRHAINFINGTNIAVTVADNTVSNRSDVTIAITGQVGMADPTTTVGDLIVRSTAIPARLPIGSNSQVLTADSAQPLGLKWSTPVVATPPVSSVFGRIGVIIATAGDYTAAQVTNAVDTTQTYSNPLWISSLAWAKISGAPAFIQDPMTAKGDLIVRSATVTTRLPAGADGQVLQTDSAQTLGVRWGSLAGFQSPWTQNIDAAGFNLTGGNLVGAVTLRSTFGAKTVSVTGTGISLATTGAPRIAWLSEGSETGVDVGSDLNLYRYNDAGSPFSALFVKRSSGRIGINNATPAYMLDVNGDINTTGVFRINGVPIITAGNQTPWISDIDAATFLLGNVTRVGIGAAVHASAQLSITGTNPTIRITGPTTTDATVIRMFPGATAWEFGAGAPASTRAPNSFYVYDTTNSGMRLLIDPAGNVGLGIPPTFKLDVAGDVNCSGLFRVNGVAIGSVSSVFNRVGAIAAASGDYTAAQVTNAVSTLGTYTDPNWLTALSWSKITGAPAAGVSSVFGRAGAVTANSGDYTVAQVTGAVATTRQVLSGLGLAGGGNLSADRTLAVLPDSVDQRVLVLNSGTLIGTRHAINFVAGANSSVSVDEDLPNNRVNVVISAAGTGLPVDPTTALGDLIIRGAGALQRLGVGTNAQVLTADSTAPLGVKWAGSTGTAQSPWTSDINAATFKLNNTGAIGVNRASDPTVARIYVDTTAGIEHGLRVLNATAAGAAAISLANDIASTLVVKLLGSSANPDPGVASLEATGAIRVLTNGATETMRLLNGRVLISTATDDTIHQLQVNGKIKSFSGGYVFPDNTVQTTAAVSVVSVTSVFSRTGVVIAQPGDYTAAQVTNAVSTIGSYSDPAWLTGLAWSKILNPPVTFVDPTTTKGDLIVRAVVTTRLGVGTNGQLLTSDDTQASGLRWTNPPPSSVTSVFSRTGVVVAASGDYTAAQVTNAVSTLGSYANPAWITSLAYAKITGVPAFMADPLTTKGDMVVYGLAPDRLPLGTNGLVLTVDTSLALGVKWAAVVAVPPTRQVIAGTGLSGGGALSADVTLAVVANATVQKAIYSLAGTAKGTRRELNFIAGTNVTITAADNAGSDRVDVTINAPTGKQTPWTSNIDAGGYYLNNVFGIGVGGPTTPAAAQVGVYVNAPSINYALKQISDAPTAWVGCTFQNDSGNAIGMELAGSGRALNPNVGCVNGDGVPLAFRVNSQEIIRLATSGIVGIGNKADVAPHSAANFQHLIFGPAKAGVTTNPMFTIAGDGGTIAWANYNIAVAEKRIAQIVVVPISTDSGSIVFQPFNAGSAVSAMTIGNTGRVTCSAGLDVTGNCNVTGQYMVNGVPIVTGGAQSPWTSDIQAAGFKLLNTGPVAVGFATASGYMLDVSGAVFYPFRCTDSVGGTMFVVTHAGVGVGTANPPLRLTTVGGMGDPGLGTAYKGAFGVFSSDVSWGTLFGGRSDGSGWIQQQRTDATAIPYALTLNPLGGPVSIGVPNPGLYTGAALVVTAGSPGGPAGAAQLQIGESSYNKDYRMQVGYSVINASWGGAVQAIAGGGGTYLYLQPSGGYTNIGPTAYLPTCQLMVVGAGQAASSPSFPTGAQGATLLISDSLGPGASGGQILFGARGGDGSAFCGIKGYYLDGGGYTAGAMSFMTRRTNADTVLTPAMWINPGGYVGINDTAPACHLSTGAVLATIKVAAYNSAGSMFGIGVQNGVLTFGAGIGEQGAATMNLSATGKLAIGNGNTASPACTLHVAVGGTYPGPTGLFIESADMTSLANGAPYYGFGRNNTNGYTQMAGYGGLTFLTSGITLTQTGTRLGFGTTLAECKVAVYDDGVNLMGLGSNQSCLKYITTANWSHRWQHGATVLMTLTYGGKLGIGSSVGSTYDLQMMNDSAGKPTTTTWINLSDARTKRNIRDLEGGLEIISKLRPVVAEYNGLAGLPVGQRVVSFLAHEIREILPFTVGTQRLKLKPEDPEESDVLDFNMHEVLFHLVLAVKQLGAKVAALEGTV